MADDAFDLFLVHEAARADGVVQVFARLTLVLQGALRLQVHRADVLLGHLVQHLVVEDAFLLFSNHSVLEV